MQKRDEKLLDINHIPKIENIGSEDIPDLSVREITAALSDMINGKSPRDDGIVIEAIKEGGTALTYAI